MPQTATAVTRKVMRAHGKTQLFSNRYGKCKTVKCYASDSLKKDNQMINEIKKAVSAINGTILGIDYNVSSYGFYGDRTAIIVRFPLD